MDDTPPMAPEDRWAPFTFPTATPTPPPDTRAPDAPKQKKRRRAPLVAAVVALSLAAGGAGGWLADAAADDSRISPSSSAIPASVAIGGGGLNVAGIVAEVEPSVVSIETRVSVRQGRWASTGRGAGTGVVLDGGLILTNAHVVENAVSVTVTGADGRARPAEVLAADPSADIAVVKVGNATGLVPATLGTGTAVKVGDDVVAIGNALALEGGLTVTRGIVSALDRSISTGTESLSGLVQTDAAISSGNSGGALVNAAGQVIGINTAVAASGGTVTASNIGFAISIDKAMATVDQLLKENP